MISPTPPITLRPPETLTPAGTPEKPFLPFNRPNCYPSAVPARARNSIIIAVTCVMAILLCLAQTASAVAAQSPEKTASGDFFGPSDIYTGEIASESLQLQWEIDPATTQTASGRQVWLTPDPIGEDGGLNLYGYVGNNPINAVDLLGLITYDDDDSEKIIEKLMGKLEEYTKDQKCPPGHPNKLEQRGVQRENHYLDEIKKPLRRDYDGYRE